MKPKYRDYSNVEYVKFIEEDLYVLVHTGDDKSLLKIQKKLKEPHLNIFKNFCSYFCIKEMAKVKYSIVLSDNPQDWGKRQEFSKLKEDANKLYIENLKSVDSQIFLESIANITYLMAKVVLKKQLEARKEFITTWARWHDYLNRKNKHEREGVKMKEKLRVILGDKIDNFEKIYLDHLDTVARVEDGHSGLFVNLDSEIDMSKYTIPSILILPSRLESYDILVIEERTECVCVGDTTYSLSGYYEAIKDTIDKDWLTANDLLKQIVIIYLIKRCQAGDKEAFKKLYNFYIEKSERMSVTFINKKAEVYKLNSGFNKEGALSEDSVKSAVGMILTTLLKGDNPKSIFQYLDKGRIEKKNADFLNKKPYVGLQEAYENMFLLFDGQFKFLKSELYNINKKSKDILHRYKTAKKSGTKKVYMQRLFSVAHYALTRATSSSTMFTLLNPSTFLDISVTYNKGLYKPAKNGNLTTWLFGSSKGFKSKILEGLEDWFEKMTFVEDGERKVRPDDYTHVSYEEEPLKNSRDSET